MEETEIPEYRTLLIDDEEEILNLSKIYLSRETDRLQLEVTKSPKEALERLRVEDFDIVVSDYRMPEMNGLELLEKIKERGWNIPFILFTGKGDESVAKMALNHGANGYIEKKSDPIEQFRELSEEILDKAEEIVSMEREATRQARKRDLLSLIGDFERDYDLSSDGGELKEVISVLSKEGSLRILESACSELHSGRGRWSDFGLSKKQYYSRLRSLQEANLIRKEVDGYTITDEGGKILNLLSLLGLVVDNSEGGKVVGKQGTSPAQFTKIDEMAAPTGGEASDRELSEFENIADYDSYVDTAIKMIEGAEQDLRTVLTFADQRVLRSFLSMDEDVELKILIPEDVIPEIEEVSKNFLEIEVEKLSKMLEKSTRVCRRFPFSYFLKDGKSLLLEEINPLYPRKFFQGFFFESERVYDRFSNLFDDLYRTAERRKPI